MTDQPTLSSLAGLRIGLFGRGGAGKSTLSVLLARACRRRGLEVVVLDADSTNLGLSEALGIERTPRALVDHFGGLVFAGGRVACPVDDPTPLEGAELALDALPAACVARSPEGIALLSTGKIAGRGPGAGCDGPMAKIARDLRVRGERGGSTPLLLVDFKAGLEDSARGVLTGLHWAIVVVDASSAGVGVAHFMRELVEQIHEGVPPALAHLGNEEERALVRRLYEQAPLRGMLSVLSGVAEAKMARLLTERLAREKVEVAATIPFDRSIALAWTEGRPLETTSAFAHVERLAETLAQAERDAARRGAA